MNSVVGYASTERQTQFPPVDTQSQPTNWRAISYWIYIIHKIQRVEDHIKTGGHFPNRTASILDIM